MSSDKQAKMVLLKDLFLRHKISDSMLTNTVRSLTQCRQTKGGIRLPAN